MSVSEFVYVLVCFISGHMFLGSSVVRLPHTVNMSLWSDRGAPGMLSCGRPPLTAIDKRLRWLLVINIPGGQQHRRQSSLKNRPAETLTSLGVARFSRAEERSGLGGLRRRSLAVFRFSVESLTQQRRRWRAAAGSSFLNEQEPGTGPSRAALNHHVPASDG